MLFLSLSTEITIRPLTTFNRKIIFIVLHTINIVNIVRFNVDVSMRCKFPTRIKMFEPRIQNEDLLPETINALPSKLSRINLKDLIHPTKVSDYNT